MSDITEERRRQARFRATLKMSFQYAGKRHEGITLDVSPAGACMVGRVRLPARAMIVLSANDPSLDEPVGRVIAQIAWSGPAPFGGADAWASGLSIPERAGSAWADLVDQVREHAKPTTTAVRRRRGAAPHADEAGATPFQALYLMDGAWFRGEIVTGDGATLWVRCGQNRPPQGSPMRLRVPVLDGDKRTAILIKGHLPTMPISDPTRRGWIFEMEVASTSEAALYARLLGTISERTIRTRRGGQAQ